MTFLFIGPTPRFPSPDDYYVNRARRGKLPAFLSLQETGALCVSSDTGEDRDRAREATALLYSLKAGGRLATVLHDGRDCVVPDSLRAVADRLAAAGFWSEAAQMWSSQGAVGAIEAQSTDEHSTPELKLALIGMSGVVRNKKSTPVSWDEFIKISALVKAASLGVRGKFTHWRMYSVMAWAARNGYTFEKAHGSPKADKADASPFGQITRQLK